LLLISSVDGFSSIEPLPEKWFKAVENDVDYFMENLSCTLRNEFWTGEQEINLYI